MLPTVSWGSWVCGGLGATRVVTKVYSHTQIQHLALLLAVGGHVGGGRGRVYILARITFD